MSGPAARHNSDAKVTFPAMTFGQKPSLPAIPGTIITKVRLGSGSADWERPDAIALRPGNTSNVAKTLAIMSIPEDELRFICYSRQGDKWHQLYRGCFARKITIAIPTSDNQSEFQNGISKFNR